MPSVFFMTKWLSSVPLQKSSLAFPTPGSSTRVQKLCASVLTPVGCRVIQSMPELSPAQSLSPGQRSLCSWLCSAALCCLPQTGLRLGPRLEPHWDLPAAKARTAVTERERVNKRANAAA